MDKAAATRGTQDITVVWVVFILAVIVLIAAYYFMLYKPKTLDIQMVQASITQKQGTLESYKKDAAELLNYEDQFAALVHSWNINQHYFINGLADPDRNGTYTPPYEGREQWAIFDALKEVWSAATYAGVYMVSMWISEDLQYYMDDQPFEVPDELKSAVGWVPNLSNRGENTNPMFTAHNFSVKFYGNMEQTRRFIEVVQKLEGDVTKIYSVHCYETADKPSYRANMIGLSDVVLTDVTLEIDMYMSVYELNPKAASPNVPPDLPGSASCSYGSSGGGRGGGGGGGGRGGGGGVGLGI